MIVIFYQQKYMYYFALQMFEKYFFENSNNTFCDFNWNLFGMRTMDVWTSAIFRWLLFRNSNFGEFCKGQRHPVDLKVLVRPLFYLAKMPLWAKYLAQKVFQPWIRITIQPFENSLHSRQVPKDSKAEHLFEPASYCFWHLLPWMALMLQMLH